MRNICIDKTSKKKFFSSRVHFQMTLNFSSSVQLSFGIFIYFFVWFLVTLYNALASLFFSLLSCSLLQRVCEWKNKKRRTKMKTQKKKTQANEIKIIHILLNLNWIYECAIYQMDVEWSLVTQFLFCSFFVRLWRLLVFLCAEPRALKSQLFTWKIRSFF